MSGVRLETSQSILSGTRLRLVQLACLLLVALKLAQWIFSGVFMDEAYYWLWGQHPALSYYDHPPLNAWLLSLSSALFGWSKLALRLPVVLTFAADIVALWLIARRLGGDWRGHFWLTLLLFLTTPVFTMVSNYALPDHVLLAALLFATAFFFRFFADRAEGVEGTTRDLLLGALFLGLGGLAKYNAAFLGFGVAAFVLLHDRALLRQVRIYLAGGLALLLQVPVIAWNVTERFASYEFILEGRHAGLAASIDGVWPLALNFLVFVSPALIWPLARFALARPSVRGIGFARAAFIISTVAIVGLAFTTLTLFHWNLVAYAVALPFLAIFMRPLWLVPLQALWGGFVAVVIFVSFSFVPLTNFVGWRDQSIAWSYDWTAITAAVETARADNDIGFVAAADYTTASLLAFALRDKDVVSISSRLDQFDYWFRPEDHSGENAILYSDTFRPITNAMRRKFESVTEIKTNTVRDGWGARVYRQTLYLARGFRPNG